MLGLPRALTVTKISRLLPTRETNQSRCPASKDLGGPNVQRDEKVYNASELLFNVNEWKAISQQVLSRLYNAGKVIRMCLGDSDGS